MTPSDDIPSGTPDGPFDEAGEYVLGLLDPAEHAAIDRRTRVDRDLAAAIAGWETRLVPLSLLVDSIPPPAWVWRRLAVGIAEPASEARAEFAAVPPRRAGPWRSLGVWRAGTAAGLALAASLALIVSIDQGRVPVGRPIAFTAVGAPEAAFVALRDRAGATVIRPVSVTAIPAGRDLELWALVAGSSKPVALGVLPAGGRTLSKGELPDGVQKLLISLEPAGGSPTGLPTGPVLYGADPH